MTREEVKSYARNKAKEFDEQGQPEALLDEDCNQAMWATQIDLIPYNVKSFNKTYSVDSRYFSLPSDCLASPNAIEDIEAGAGAKSATSAISSGSGVITITAKEPGTEWDDWTMELDDTGTLGNVALNFTDKEITATYNGSTTTNQQMIDALNNDAVFSEFFTATATQPSEAMSDSDISFSETSGASGTGYKPCSEMSVKDKNRILSDTYSKPTATQPKYLRHGNSTGTQMIEIFPDTMKYAKVYYYYRFAAMTADTDTLPIPDEYREIYLLKLLTKIYETLNRVSQEQEKKMDFAKKKQDIEKNYIETLNNIFTQNRKIEANDNQS